MNNNKKMQLYERNFAQNRIFLLSVIKHNDLSSTSLKLFKIV